MSEALEDGDWPCKPCARVFPSWESLQQHKAYKTKTGDKDHIHCQICGQDFMTEVAQRRHVQQSHPKDQVLDCPGCGRGPFHRISSLMEHIESGDCPRFDSSALDEAREKKLEFTRRLAALTNAPVKNDYSGFVSAVDKPVGGSRIALAAGAQESASPIVHPESPSVARQEEDKAGFEKTASWGDADRPWSLEAWKGNENMVPDAAPTHRPSSQHPEAAAQPRNEKLIFQSIDAHDPDNPSFSARRYYCEIMEQYICPKPGCGKVFKTGGRLIGHLRSPAHGDKTFRCPCCHKAFKSLTAITSHVESSSVNCRIRETEGYNAYLDQLTAGMVDIGKQSADGTLHYITTDRFRASLGSKKGDAKAEAKAAFW